MLKIIEIKYEFSILIYSIIQKLAKYYFSVTKDSKFKNKNSN